MSAETPDSKVNSEAKHEDTKPATPAPVAAPADDRGSRGGTANLLGVLGFAATLAIGFYAGRWIKEEYFTDAPSAAEDGRYTAELRGDEPVFGPDDALVTVIEFSDFQCPFCAKAEPDLKDAVESVGDTRVIFKQLPLRMHSRAVPAAKAALAAHQQGKFWEMKAKLFENQRALSEENFAQWASDLGLDVEQFKKDLASAEVSKLVDEDFAAAQKIGCTGTPCFLVNGRPYSGALNAGQWKKILKAERSHAKSLGLPAEAVYAALMNDAKPTRGGGKVGVLPSQWSKGGGRPGDPDPNKRYRVLPDDRPQTGPADALVTIVEFSDFECPYCQRVTNTLDQLKESYGDDVRVVFRQNPLPFHRNARPAAVAALAAHRQGKFWEMHDELFRHRQQLGESTYKELAEKLSLDLEQFDRDRNDPTLAKMIDDDVALARRMGASGTPAFFINGRFLSGAVPIDQFRAVIDAEKAVAEAEVAKGTAKAQVLETLLRSAETEHKRPAAENKAAAGKPIQPADAKGATGESADAKGAAGESADAKAADAKAGDGKAADAKAAEGNPAADTKADGKLPAGAEQGG